MSAIKKFDHPKELLHKLYREGRRANLANTEIDIVDCVFNFLCYWAFIARLDH